MSFFLSQFLLWMMCDWRRNDRSRHIERGIDRQIERGRDRWLQILQISSIHIGSFSFPFFLSRCFSFCIASLSSLVFSCIHPSSTPCLHLLPLSFPAAVFVFLFLLSIHRSIRLLSVHSASVPISSPLTS